MTTSFPAKVLRIFQENVVLYIWVSFCLPAIPPLSSGKKPHCASFYARIVLFWDFLVCCTPPVLAEGLPYSESKAHNSARKRSLVLE